MDNKNKITEGVIWKQLLYFFFPILIGTFFQQLYNTTDAIIVGNYVGKSALAAVGATSDLLSLFLGFFIGLSTGASVIISQYYGASKGNKVGKSVHTSIALAIIFGLVLMIFGIIVTPASLRVIGIPEDIFMDAKTYMTIYFTGMIPSLIYNMGSGILRAVGDSKSPLYFLMISCIANIILDIVFVVILRLGVLGVSIATVLSQVISAILVLVVLTRSKESYHLNIKRFFIDRFILKEIVNIGIPTGLQAVLYAFSNIIIQAKINGFGTNTIAAWSAYIKIDGIFWMIMSAFGVATTTFVAQNYGAKRYDRINKSIKTCMLMSMVVAISLSVLLTVFGRTIFSMFTSDHAVIDIGVEAMSYMTPYYFAYVCIEILSGAIRGVGESIKPMIINIVGICLFRLVWLIFVVPLNLSIKFVVLSYPISWVATSLMLIIYYYKGNWLKKK